MTLITPEQMNEAIKQAQKQIDENDKMGMYQYRFVLEQRITECMNILDDIRDVYTIHQDMRELSVDEMANTLMGIQHLYQIKFELLFDTFEKHLKGIHNASV